MFRNETYEWYHIYVNNEEIICTGLHPFYVQDKGFIKAKDLLEKENVLLYNNEWVSISKIEIEKLDKPETTYNFEVEDYHTYYVSESGILVHNDCKKINLEFESYEDAVDYANNVLGPNSTIIDKNGVTFNVSSDGHWTWRLDYHGTLSRMPQAHINLERWKLPFGTKGNTLLENRHLWF